MNMKVCTKCGKTKCVITVTRSKSKKGLRYVCKPCLAASKRIYSQKNAKKFNEYKKKWRQENIELARKREKERRLKNATLLAEYQKKYRKSNTENRSKYMKQYERERKKTDPLYKLARNVRTLVGKSFKRVSTYFKKESKTETLLGCTIPELRDHLEKQFLPGMTFENHGRDGWHIDHIIPLASAKTQEEVEKLCHYTNLQPLWASDNIRKGNKT